MEDLDGEDNKLEEAKKADLAEKQRLESAKEWEEILEDGQIKRRKIELASEANKARVERENDDYDDMDLEIDAKKSDDAEDLYKGINLKNNANGGASSSTANGKANDNADNDDGAKNDRVRPRRGTRGNKDKKKEKKAAKKEAQREADKEEGGKGGGKGKKDEDPDRFVVAKVAGEEKARKVDTKRLCKYIDFDAPLDLRNESGGKFREIASYDDL